MEIFMNNWEAFAAGFVVVLASADKLIVMLVNSLGNVRDAWRSVFPKKEF